MSKLLPFTAIIVTTGNDGCLLYHTVQVNVTHPSTIMFSEEVLELLNHERQTERRISMLQRLHQRYTILRAARERVEIIKEAIRP
jgi:hypothetical protein